MKLHDTPVSDWELVVSTINTSPKIYNSLAALSVINLEGARYLDVEIHGENVRYEHVVLSEQDPSFIQIAERDFILVSSNTLEKQAASGTPRVPGSPMFDHPDLDDIFDWLFTSEVFRFEQISKKSFEFSDAERLVHQNFIGNPSKFTADALIGLYDKTQTEQQARPRPGQHLLTSVALSGFLHTQFMDHLDSGTLKTQSESVWFIVRSGYGATRECVSPKFELLKNLLPSAHYDFRAAKELESLA